MGDTADLTVEILKQIRDGVFETKADVTTLRSQVTYIHQELMLTNARLEASRVELKGEIEASRIELKGEIEALRVELKDDIDTTNRQLRALRVELKDEIGATNERLDTTNERLDTTNERLDTMRVELKDEIGQLRHTVGRVARISDETLTVSLDDSGRMDALEGRVRNLEVEMQALRPHQ